MEQKFYLNKLFFPYFIQILLKTVAYFEALFSNSIKFKKLPNDQNFLFKILIAKYRTKFIIFIFQYFFI